MLKIKHYTFILILCSIFFGSNSFAQSVTWNTVTQGTGLLGNNGAGGITFVIENTNGFPAVLNTVSNYYSSNNTSNVELWYSTTSLSGATNAITPANGWTQIATGSVPVNNNTPFNATVGTLNTLFTNLNFTINPGTTYRFYILSSVSLEYTGLTNPTGAAPLSYNFNGVNLHTGEYLINNAFVGFGGSGTNGPPNNPRAFCGEVNLTLLSTPCNGQPVAGTTTASTLTPCPGSLVSFALTGSTSAGGLSYQWIRANTSSGPWVALPGASNATYQTLTTGNRCFRCIVTCLSNGLFDTSSVICVNTIPWSPVGNCWCIPQYATGGVNNLITNFSLDNLNNNTSLSSNVTPFWVDYTGAQTGSNPTLSIPNLYIGLPATANVTFGSSTTNFSAIWIDFNHNGAFDTTEYYSSTLNPGANGTQAITINVPGAAQSGITRMRIRGGHNAQMLKTHACGFTNSTLGEAEDYLVNVVPSSLKDPAITSINVPSGSCLTTNESVTVNLANYGSTNINLLLDSVKVTLKVNGPLGLVNYNKTVSSGSLFSYGGNSIPITFTGVNLYDGGTYFINTSLAFAPPGGGASNVVLINDSLFSPIIKVNVRPVAGPDFHVCQNSPILFGQGLSVSGCANPVYDSIELVFTVTPCQDNTGATTNGTSQTVPGAGCANTFACDFASVNIPSLPTGAYFTQNGLLTVSNLSSGFRNEVRFNLYGASPNPPTLFAPCQQGFAVGTVFTTGQSVGTNAFFFNRRLITLPQLSAIFNPANVNTPLHLGYFESWNDLVNASDLTPNSNGPTEVKLKVWYAYIPAKIKWYDNNTSTTLLDTLVPFNPLSPNVLSPTTQLSNTSNPGTYTFFATCDGAVDCRVPVNLIVDPTPLVFQDTISLCEDLVGSNQAIFDLTTLNSSVSGGTAPPNIVEYFGDQGLFGPIATPTNDTSSTNFIYSKITNLFGCYSSDSVYLEVNSLPQFVPNVINSGTVCFPSTIDAANLIGAFSTVPSNADTSYYEDAACTIPYNNPHQISNADTVYIVLATNTFPVCSDTAVAYIDITQAGNKIANQVTPGNYSDCLTPINCGNVTLTDGGIETYYTSPSCLKVANVTDAVNGIDLGSTQICETIDCTIQTHNGQPYVNRVYQITPTTNDSGTVCLYYLDDDFDQYNAYASANGWPLLPLSGGPANLGNIAISRVENGPLTTLGSYIGATIPNNLITSSFDPSTSVWTICFPTDSFSHFYVHSLNPNNIPLPVSLVFNGKRVEGTSILNWVTMMENNNSHFVVERSKDGKTFSKISDKIASKAAQGNSQSRLDYAYTDAIPMNGHNYYRLEQNDLDGHQSYSKVVDVYFGNETVVTMYPNPVSTLLHIDINTPKATLARARIIDAAGRVVRKVDMQLQAGNNESEIDMQGLADGVYQIQISNEKGLSFSQLIRKN